MSAPMTAAGAATISITPELRQAIAESGFACVEDQETGEVYALAKVRVENTLEQEICEGIRKSQAAFARDLPDLLQNKRNLRKWVAYNRDRRIIIHKNPQKVLRECLRLGLESGEFIIDMIDPNALDSLETDYPSSWS